MKAYPSTHIHSPPPDVLSGNDLQESAEAADGASSCAAQTDALLVAERRACGDLRAQLQQLGVQAGRADDLERQLADAQQVCSLANQQVAKGQEALPALHVGHAAFEFAIRVLVCWHQETWICTLMPFCASCLLRIQRR